MIFVYPASVSENCDKRIVPAVCKSIERFFLLQLQDAFTSGVLTAKRVYEPTKGNYGPLLLESVNNYNDKQYLLETSYSLKNPVLLESKKDDYTNRIEELQYKYSSQELIDNPNKIDEIRSELRGIHREIAASSMSSADKQTLYRLIDDLEMDLRNRERDARNARRDEAKTKSDLANANDKKSKPTGLGSYRPTEGKVDIIPTGATVKIPVLYHGGPNAAKYDKDTEVNINVKVIPMYVKNFVDIEDAMLDDYFTKQSEAFFKSIGRKIIRGVKNILGRFGPLGDFVSKKLGGDDDVKNDIIYNSQGFVNASAFHKSSHSPNNYNYTSNVVIFNKDDLSDPDNGNIFRNRSAMQKMFRLGWSTFAMLDPVDEMMYFISSLDGGLMHEIPYRYIMESIGSKCYYGDENKLKNGARPFRVSRGNFATFSRKFED